MDSGKIRKLINPVDKTLYDALKVTEILSPVCIPIKASNATVSN